MGKQKDKKEKQRARRGPATVAQSREEAEAAEAEMVAQVKEIEERLQVLTKELKQVEGAIRGCAMEAKRAQLTTKELEPLADDAKIYRQVGRMWIQQPKKDMANSLQASTALKAVESNQLKLAHQKLQLKMKGEADGLRELLGPEKMKRLADGTLFGGPGGGTYATGGGATSPEDSIMPIFGKSTAPASAAVADAAATKEDAATTATDAAEGATEA
mmetsp:Transcript_103082/g.269120  ORF Transcript_103082/g.269120 Transcript_103082/m.269120 type:complete len:216 (+) Transcript_103082:134-781(+)